MAKTTTKTGTAAAKAPAKASSASPAAKKAPTAKKAAASPPSPSSAKAPAPTTVTQKHLSTALAERHTLPKKQAESILADVFGMVVEHLKAGERVRISGLGIIEVKNRPARMGRNPATGASIQIAASKKIAFRAAKDLKEAV